MTDIPPEIKKGRNQLAAVIVIGHALKHVYMGGFQAVILPEIKIGLSLVATGDGLDIHYGRRVSGRPLP